MFRLLVLSMLLLVSCQVKDDNKMFKVAIVTPVTHPSLEAIERGFKDTLSVAHPVEFKTFNSQGNTLLLRQNMDVALQGGYDMVFAVATQPALIAKERAKAKGVDIPIIYSAVVDPEGLGLSSFTGSIEKCDYDQFFQTVLPQLGEINELLLVYDPLNWYFETYAKKIKEIVESKGIKLRKIEVLNVQDMVQKVSVKGSDAVLVLKDNTVVSGLEALVKKCVAANIPLIASDLDSFQRGANICYGVEEIDYGRVAAGLALQVLDEGKKVSEIAPVVVDQYQLLTEKDHG